MVEQLAVNQRVVGSSPTSGAIFFVFAVQQLKTPQAGSTGATPKNGDLRFS